MTPCSTSRTESDHRLTGRLSPECRQTRGSPQTGAATTPLCPRPRWLVTPSCQLCLVVVGADDDLDTRELRAAARATAGKLLQLNATVASPGGK